MQTILLAVLHAAMLFSASGLRIQTKKVSPDAKHLQSLLQNDMMDKKAFGNIIKMITSRFPLSKLEQLAKDKVKDPRHYMKLVPDHQLFNSLIEKGSSYATSEEMQELREDVWSGFQEAMQEVEEKFGDDANETSRQSIVGKHAPAKKVQAFAKNHSVEDVSLIALTSNWSKKVEDEIHRAKDYRMSHFGQKLGRIKCRKNLLLWWAVANDYCQATFGYQDWIEGNMVAAQSCEIRFFMALAAACSQGNAMMGQLHFQPMPKGMLKVEHY